MPLMIKLNRNVVSVYLCLDNGHFITVYLFSEEKNDILIVIAINRCSQAYLMDFSSYND